MDRFCAICGATRKGDQVTLYKLTARDDNTQILWKDFLTSLPTHAGVIHDNTHLCNRHFCTEAFQNEMAYKLGYSSKLLLQKNAVPILETRAETSSHTVSIPNYLIYIFSA